MKARSLKSLLVVSLVGLISIAALVSSAVSFRESTIEAGELFDAKLAQSARVLVSLADEELARAAGSPAESQVVAVWKTRISGEGERLATQHGHAYETKVAFQVFDDAGRIVLRSANAPDVPFAAIAPGYAHAETAGQRWRVFTARAPSGLWYAAAERDDVRGELARDIAFGTLLPTLIEVPLLALLVWAVVSWGCRPLARVGVELEARAADRLDAIAVQGAPAEVQSLVGAINGVLSRLRVALARERDLTADAAHELRTPIAALRVHVDNLAAARDDGARRESQHAIARSAARLDRLVSQLMQLAQLEAGAVALERAPVDLAAVAARELAELAPAALAKQVEVSLERGDQVVRVSGDDVTLGVLVRNLADNAIRHTPAGGVVRVTVAREGERGILRVEDSGPGIPTESRSRVFDRFHRELENESAGSGLGLSIVRRIADLHGAAVVLGGSALGGLDVKVDLPLAFDR